MQNTQADEQPVLACNLGAIEAAERDTHVVRAEQLFSTVLETKELATGYAFRLPMEAPKLVEIAQWITNERLCCPFFTFTMVVGDQLWLELTGAESIKDELIAMARSIGATGTVPDRDEWIAAHTSEESAEC